MVVGGGVGCVNIKLVGGGRWGGGVGVCQH